MGIADPDHLASRLSAQTLGEWEAFEDHYGPLLLHERIDVAGAMVAYVTAAVAGVKDHELSDYMPKWGHEPQAQQSEEAMLAALMRLKDGGRARDHG